MSNALGNNGGRLYSFGSQPVLIDCNFVVDSSNGNGLGIRNLKGQGVRDVFMYTSASAGTSHGILNPMAQSASQGYALIRLKGNYNRYLGGFSGFVSPSSGSTIRINSGTAGLTVGVPYVIASTGVGPAGQATIAPVADVSGSLAGTYFLLYDAYGNTFVIWFSVAGVGFQPQLGPASPDGTQGFHYVQQTIASGATAATIGTALATTIAALPSGVNGVFSFTATGTTTVTVVSTLAQPLSSIPQDGSGVIPSQGPAVAITFTITSGSATAGSVWTDGLGHLYTVSATIASQTTLKTTGVGVPGNNGVGTLTYVSGSGATTALSFSAAVAGFATGFTFALTVSDTNLADWQGVGLYNGLTPTVGQSFIAKSTGVGASTGTAIAAGVSGITSLEVIGDPSQSLAPMPQGGSPHVGGFIIVQFLGATNSSTTTLIPKAPANNSVVGMSFYVDAKYSPSNVNGAT
jgi:hypothetical protein